MCRLFMLYSSNFFGQLSLFINKLYHIFDIKSKKHPTAKAVGAWIQSGISKCRFFLKGIFMFFDFFSFFGSFFVIFFVRQTCDLVEQFVHTMTFSAFAHIRVGTKRVANNSLSLIQLVLELSIFFVFFRDDVLLFSNFLGSFDIGVDCTNNETDDCAGHDAEEANNSFIENDGEEFFLLNQHKHKYEACYASSYRNADEPKDALDGVSSCLSFHSEYLSFHILNSGKFCL